MTRRLAARKPLVQSVKRRPVKTLRSKLSQSVPHSARERQGIGLVALVEKSRADHDVGFVVANGLEYLGYLFGGVLAICVDLNGHLVSVQRCVAVAGLHGTPDAEVEG